MLALADVAVDDTQNACGGPHAIAGLAVMTAAAQGQGTAHSDNMPGGSCWPLVFLACIMRVNALGKPGMTSPQSAAALPPREPDFMRFS
jgi:hypothetical protein